MFSHTENPVLLDVLNCTDSDRDNEANEWYENVYLPHSLSLGGVLTAQRYICAYQRAGKPHYMKAQYINAYEVGSRYKDADASVLKQAPSHIDMPLKGVFAPLGELRRRATQTDSPVVATLVVISNCADAERLAEFNDWYDSVHLSHMLSVPGVVSARRYQCVHQTRGRSQYMAVYDVDTADYETLDHDLKAMLARQKAERLRPEPELNDPIVSNFYVPMGDRRLARASMRQA